MTIFNDPKYCNNSINSCKFLNIEDWACSKYNNIQLCKDTWINFFMFLPQYIKCEQCKKEHGVILNVIDNEQIINCEQCKFHTNDPENPMYYLCIYNPPVVLALEFHIETHWPSVGPNSKCGKFEKGGE